MSGLRLWTLVAAAAAGALGLLASCAPVAPAPSGALSQHELDALAAQWVLGYAVVANRGAGACTRDVGAGACFESTITLTAPHATAARDWSLWFSQVDPVAHVDEGEFTLEHVNGDLHRITPTPQFRGFRAGETKTLRLVSRGLMLTDAKFMPNAYLTADGLQARVIDSTRTRIDAETGLELRPYAVPLRHDPDQFRQSPTDALQPATATWLYSANARTPAGRELDETAIVPTPMHVAVPADAGHLSLAKGVRVRMHAIERSSVEAALKRLHRLGVAESAEGVPLAIAIDPGLSPHAAAYRLDVTAHGIAIVAADAAGAFYGVQSLAALVRVGSAAIPRVSVVDHPRYAFRGLHLDVARNFHSKALVVDVLDQMAAYKLNVLHFHLGDDEGWRLQIPGLPELSEIGSRRCHDLSEDRCLIPQLGSGPDGDTAVDGYYRVEDYLEIVRAARDRYIEVIPSFDMPGHSRAAVKAMEARYRRLQAQGRAAQAAQYRLSDPDDTTRYQSIQFYRDNTLNVCIESTYAFLDKVIGEVAALHTQAGQPLRRYHIGADETAGAWHESPACRAYLAHNVAGIGKIDQLGGHFIERVAALLAARGIEPAAWSDGLSHANAQRLPPTLQSNAWGLLAEEGHVTAHQHANRGWRVVLSLPEALYFDFPQEADPAEHGNHWATRRLPVRKVWELMPDNLPAHAQVWRDAQDHPMRIDDSAPGKTGGEGERERGPLRPRMQVAGIQGQVWSETLRSDGLVEFMLFPRLLALAERAWHKAAWEPAYDVSGAVYDTGHGPFDAARLAEREQDWQHFTATLGLRELAKLDLAQIAYRLPTVGAIREDGVLHANCELPGLPIEYRESGGSWQRYRGPVAVRAGPVEVRVVAARGERRGRSLIVP